MLILRRLPRWPGSSAASACALILCIFFLFRGLSHLPDLSLPFAGGPSEAVESSAFTSQQSAFWRAFYADLIQYAPGCDPVTHTKDTHLDIFYNASDHRPRPDYLTLSGSQLLQLRTTHANFTNRLRSLDYTLPYVKRTRGIVTTAGGSYLPVAVVSIQMLRETGSQLPVEVFLASESEWDSQICDVVFPSMNTRCVVLQRIFDGAGHDKAAQIDKYQYKVMSILFSSFEEVLFMDSDCFPVFDPNEIFDHEPFTSTGLILWPDFWFPSESAFFFEIAQIPAPAISSRPSTESGEIFYSKSRHALSLMLAAYYNYYGPDYYYNLQSQGAPGEGDKETFLWGAVVFDEPLYTVKRGVSAMGYWTTKGEWRGSAMVQFDPVQDLRFHSSLQEPVDKSADPKSPSQSRNQPRPFFVHANFPKFDPATIFQENAMGATGPTRDADGTTRRVWQETASKAIDMFGFDLERRLWKVIKSIACDYEGTFGVWRGRDDICENASQYWNALFDNHTDHARFA